MFLLQLSLLILTLGELINILLLCRQQHVMRECDRRDYHRQSLPHHRHLTFHPIRSETASRHGESYRKLQHQPRRVQRIGDTSSVFPPGAVRRVRRRGSSAMPGAARTTRPSRAGSSTSPGELVRHRWTCATTLFRGVIWSTTRQRLRSCKRRSTARSDGVT